MIILDSQRQTINDLRWALTSPNLLLSPPDNLTGNIASDILTTQLLNGIDFNTQFSSSAKRLGHYFEELIAYAIENNPQFTLIAKNLGIFEGKQQRGEFDFIFTHQNTTYHWETAVKFYLYHPDSQVWYGPNARDRLDKKLDKLFNRQLSLSQLSSAKQLLRDKFNLTFPLKNEALIKGFLFYPFRKPQQQIQHNWINPKHLRGWWCFQKELQYKLASVEPSHRWAILPRLQWLSHASLIGSAEVFTANQLLDKFSEQTSPPLLVELRSIENTWQEVSRGFVVPETWPR